MTLWPAASYPAGDNSKEDPGAREVGSAEYVDIIVARRDKWSQEFVRKSIQKLDEKSKEKFGKCPWEVTGYLGPVTWPRASTEMINRHYSSAQEDTTFTFGG